MIIADLSYLQAVGETSCITGGRRRGRRSRSLVVHINYASVRQNASSNVRVTSYGANATAIAIATNDSDIEQVNLFW